MPRSLGRRRLDGRDEGIDAQDAYGHLHAHRRFFAAHGQDAFLQSNITALLPPVARRAQAPTRSVLYRCSDASSSVMAG